MGGSKSGAEIDVASTIAAHRGAMSANDSARGRSPGLRSFMTLVVVLTSLLGGVLFWEALHRHPQVVKAETHEDIVANTLPPLTPYVPTPSPPSTALAPSPLMAPPQVPVSETSGPTPEDLEMQRRFSGGFTGKGGGSSSDTTQTTATASGDQTQNSALMNQLGPLKIKPSKATMLSDRNYLLTRGAMIDCGQQTMLVTDQPGMVTCYTTSDTYSANGHVVLVDAGSKIVGSYQHGIMQGQNRVFVAWQRIETPNGAIIDLDSPGTDPLGAAGEPGRVDTHFWDRFGGAIMLSLIGDAGNAGVQAVANHSNSDITLNNTTGTANQMSEEALRNTINIPPTLYKDAGDRVSIYVARDLDFSDVYALKPE